ncbi:MAG: helix-turn-helix domain-containing protein [Clostridia bacterium]|nr:helix-turn-helix domain-containing protein [Clostridia bacterium]
MSNFVMRIPDIMNYNAEYYCEDSNRLKPERVWQFHMHDRMELYILLEGDVSFVVESSLYKLSPGDAIVVRPNERHHCILNTCSVHKHWCFWFDTASTFLFGDFVSREYGRNNHIVPDPAAKEDLLRIYDKLKEASADSDIHRQFCTILEMLNIFRRFLPNASCPQTLPAILSDILADIDRDFKNIHTLDQIRNKYFISSSTLNRMFRTHLGTTPKMYLESKRLAHSRMLLKNGKSVLAACMESGFSDCSNYIRLFKKHFNITPGQYRGG